jgi:hypothetical protein
LNATVNPTWAVTVLRLQILEHELKLNEMGVTRDLDKPTIEDHRRGPAANHGIYEHRLDRIPGSHIAAAPGCARRA